MQLRSLPGCLLDRLPGFCVDVPVDDWELITQPKYYDFFDPKLPSEFTDPVPVEPDVSLGPDDPELPPEVPLDPVPDDPKFPLPLD